MIDDAFAVLQEKMELSLFFSAEVRDVSLLKAKDGYENR